MNYLSAMDFWGDEGSENPYNQLIEALLGSSQEVGGEESEQRPMPGQPGGFPPAGNMGAGQFQPGNLPPSGNLPAWLTNQDLPPGMTYGSEEGAKIADNADWIGRGVGALTGLPGMTLLAKALASRYYDNNVFMNQADVPQGRVAEGIDEMLYGAVPQQSPMVDPASRGDNSRQNKAYSGAWGPGSGSRMNANSAFIYGMGLGNGQQHEDQRVATRISRDK